MGVNFLNSASRRFAIVFECVAFALHRSLLKSASNWAPMKRILECSCMLCFLINLNGKKLAVLKKTTASPNIIPFLVPPKERTSTPASDVNSRNSLFKLTAAFAIRDPSIWSKRLYFFAIWEMCFISSAA